ncbi:MAG TPA: indole-3-glycerol phosphate synthase TrpC [bacterium]|nr:indole-3-glycerol phosphate synthase TrpC [bacterium]
MILDEIVAHKRVEVAARMARRSAAEVAAAAQRLPAAPDFRAALASPELAVIAEIKGASPSAGTIRGRYDPVGVAAAYEAGGAAALSVLTDERYFHGSWEDLTAVAQGSRLPVLCKEFIVDPYQIDEARAAGAAAVLLIARVLSPEDLRAYLGYARRRGLGALVEVHSQDEVRAALDADADCMAINNRDLRTLRVDLETTAQLRPLIPDGVVVVSESGFERREQVAWVERLGVDAILVGTTLMASGNPAETLRELRGVR